MTATSAKQYCWMAACKSSHSTLGIPIKIGEIGAGPKPFEMSPYAVWHALRERVVLETYNALIRDVRERGRVRGKRKDWK